MWPAKVRDEAVEHGLFAELIGHAVSARAQVELWKTFKEHGLLMEVVEAWLAKQGWKLLPAEHGQT